MGKRIDEIKGEHLMEHAGVVEDHGFFIEVSKDGQVLFVCIHASL
jgi:hypothetical protein